MEHACRKKAVSYSKYILSNHLATGLHMHSRQEIPSFKMICMVILHLII